MTPADTLRLLTLAAAYDPTVLPSDHDDRAIKAQAWALAIDHRLDYPDAQAAVIRHYRRNATRSITVADLNDAAPTITGAVAAIEAATANWCPPPPDIADQLHPKRNHDDRAALLVTCPWCGARPHDPCTRPTTDGPVPLTGEGTIRTGHITHPSRRHAALESA